MPIPAVRRRLVASSITLIAVGSLVLAIPAAGEASPSASPSATLNAPVSIVLSGSVSLSGEPRVGSPITAVSTVVPTPSNAVLAGSWLRDGVPIAGADGPTYVPTTDDLGSLLEYRETASLLGLLDASVTSSPSSPVLPALPSGGSGSLPALPLTGAITLQGDPEVGQTLQAVSSVVTDPVSSGAGQWLRDGSPIDGATDPLYMLQSEDLGHVLSYQMLFAVPGFLDAVLHSGGSAPVGPGSFDLAPKPVITGEQKVGQTLTADEGLFDPLADSFTYQWYADGTAIDGATLRTLHLGAAQVHRQVTAQVTALRAGFVSVTGTSDPTAPIATDQAPDLRLTADRTRVPLSRTARLTWHSVDATTLTASGAWSGTRASDGTATVKPARLGNATYTLSATNDNGTTRMQVTVRAVPAAKVLPVTATGARHSVSRTLRVRAGGLYPHEAYTIRVAGLKVATGRASARGVASRTVHLRHRARARHTTVQVSGMVASRTGRTDARTGRDTRLGLRAYRRAGAYQVVSLSRLAPGEQVHVRYQGRQIAPGTARASAKGTFRLRFATGKSTGQRRVSATGLFSHRSAGATFRVVRH